MLKYLYTIIVLLLFVTIDMQAGNPDRQGEAGAPQLLMTPWARTAGLHLMNTSYISGAEALRLNPAGIVRVNGTQVYGSHTRYLSGTDVGLNAFGLAQRVGKNGALGISIMAIDLGDMPITTEANPEPGIDPITFSPSFFNMGVGYAHMFENKVSVGIVFRFVSESTAQAAASSFAIDAGVQYVTGPQDNFKIGISLRNVGAPMKYRGEAFTEAQANPDGTLAYTLTYELRPQKYELPSLINLGTSYDFVVNPRNKLTILANFTANSFSQDQIGGGLEYTFNNMFSLRGAYKYEFGSTAEGGNKAPIYTGIAAGVSIQVPLKKDTDKTFAIDYGYRHTKRWDGSHSLGIRFDL